MSEDSSALVVGNNQESRAALLRLLEGAGYNTITADCGTQALDIVKRFGVTLVLCDWKVQDMSGADFCASVRNDLEELYVYFIFYDGNTEMNPVKAMDIGADDFVAMPLEQQVFDAKIKSAARIISLQKKLTDRNDFLEFAYANVTTDLKIAAKVQEDLLPTQFRLAGLDTNWMFKPASFVAGDMFDYFPVGNDHFVFYILDVEGHGIASALTSFAINNQLNPSSHGLCAKSINESSSTAEAVISTLDSLNRQFESNLNSSRYFTMIYGIIEIPTGEVTLCQAGHPSPVHLQRKAEKAVSLGDGGMPVGLIKEAEYSTVSCSMNVGDRLFIYSDGMLECENKSGEFYGTERLVNRIQEWHDLPIDELGDLFDGEITQWNGSSNFHDDVSMVILEYTGKR